jgi:competence protein ComGC
MFISNYEKNRIRIQIQTLEAQVMSLQSQVEEFMLKKKAPALRTAEAPWGYKKDGTPRKRYGRPPQVMEITS